MKEKVNLAAESYSNTNSFWAALTIETLSRLGVNRVVISPGSRSTALTIASALNEKVKTNVILDERSAAFFALGLARASALPVALICTSGTALAHYFPAVIEAYYQQIPLIILSADRPAEMRDCQSGQSIDQIKIFGNYARFFHEVALPEAKKNLWQYLRQTLSYAVEIAREQGPVHLNFPFREPLVPVVDDSAVGKDALDESFFAGFESAENLVVQYDVTVNAMEKQRCLIVVGQYRTKEPELFAESLRIISEKLNAPILADVLNPLRSYADVLGERLICAYDRVLRDKDNAERLRPDFVVQIGVPPTSKILRSWLEKSCTEALILDSSNLNVNALHLPSRQIRMRVEHARWNVTGGGHISKDYLRNWRRADAAAVASFQDIWSCEGKAFCCGEIPSKLIGFLPENTPIFIANSLSIRNAEWFFSANEKRFDIYCNRGANGIDGTVSTALGVAVASGKPTVLWVGDLAFLHDTNALLISASFSGSLTILLIQNRGGRIFEHLPVCDFPCAFEHYFITEQSVDIAKLVSAYGISHDVVKTCSELEAYLDHLPEKGIRVIECLV